ncbi:carbohydrate esterase family 4 protein [Heterobasidion irregulare TC 32-1]|uniref:chitin deacetylase n=1 Tax=Heterobasidion irregulare (strain TC 32-1) TaxID=747525 RepID=W4JSE8_HETIT|nr:carbohydrate esterase family 4 protein [Heterobasidion irregulare TC 32-1]ETW76379.1 carbohydrate esterase family 4 protein [Heterobasidion irregulare TC 32-1]
MRFQTFFTDTRASAQAHVLLLVSLALAASAQDRTTEKAEASITDPTQECTPYYYAPSANYIHNFPTIWQPATILPTDTAAQAKWASISSSVPTNIQPRGTAMGDFSNVTYDTVNDPACWWTAAKCTTPKLAGLQPDVSSVPEPKTIGYGFDDGPNCSHNAFYDYLQSKNQKATMYFIGSNVMDWPLEAQRALTDGHEICVHTWSHRYMTSFSSPDAFAELWYTMQAIKAVTGVTPTCWRPPFGDVDDRIRAIANGLGLQTILWKYDSNDWRAGVGGVTAQDVDNDYQSFINNATSGTFNTQGGIMLTHELNNFTMSEAMKYYPMLSSAFAHIVPVGVALNKTQPYVESNYSMPSFAQYIAGTSTSNGSSSTGSSSTSSSSSASSSSSSSHSDTSGGSAQGSKSAALPSTPLLSAHWAIVAGAGLLASLVL